MALTEVEIGMINEYMTHYPEKRPALMDSLRLIQKNRRYIPKEERKEIAALLDIPAKDVDGVISFYTMYTDKPQGKYHIQVCTNGSCKVKGGAEILEYVSEYIGLKHNETDAEEFLSLEEVECMGACGGAPMVAINDKYYENSSIEQIKGLIDDLKK